MQQVRIAEKKEREHKRKRTLAMLERAGHVTHERAHDYYCAEESD